MSVSAAKSFLFHRFPLNFAILMRETLMSTIVAKIQQSLRKKVCCIDALTNEYIIMQCEHPPPYPPWCSVE